jgi:AcrR family transcriptional regulator
MREWIPISTSPRGRLALVAVREFGTRPYRDVTVGELAAAAGVTTGALYHHFDSKLGLYAVARTDVERRLLDRMEGAAATASGVAQGVRAAMLVGFDFAVAEDFTRLLGDPAPVSGVDAVADLLERLSGDGPALGRVLAAAWRAAVVAVADGVPIGAVRQALVVIGSGLSVDRSLPDPG